ncbi:hypothetical protein [Bifidobacterium thermacidophilum]|uniref:hypothetical protein n=1 Tax=Bifidobacterium thermacidophilum TaxID=246618 RepID=UPI003EFD0BBD
MKKMDSCGDREMVTDAQVMKLLGVSGSMIDDMVETGELAPVHCYPRRFALCEVMRLKQEVDRQHRAFVEPQKVQREMHQRFGEQLDGTWSCHVDDERRDAHVNGTACDE